MAAPALVELHTLELHAAVTRGPRWWDSARGFAPRAKAAADPTATKHTPATRVVAIGFLKAAKTRGFLSRRWCPERSRGRRRGPRARRGANARARESRYPTLSPARLDV